MTRPLPTLLALALAACGGATTPPADVPPPSPYISGFNPGPAPAGHTRYVAPVIPEIKPGEDVMYCQWVAAASDDEMEVVDVTGEQSKYGHHIVLYATATKAPVGTSRKCLDSDMLSVRFIGGIGGEGATAIKLPAGYAYRVPKGFALMANVHYVNVSPGPIQGQGVVDVQLRKPDGTSKTADIMTNLDTTLNVPARKACTEDAQCGEAKCDKAAKLCDTKFALDVSCKFEKEMTAVMWSNHVHEWGTKVSSKLVRADGTEELLSTDDPWEKEMTYNPRFRTYPAEAPLVFRPGDTVTTHCEWNNDTGGDLPFGPEMCVGIAFYVTTPELTGMQVCDKGEWSVQ